MRLFIRMNLFAAAFLIAGLFINTQAADRVKTLNGMVEGTGKQKSGVRMFKGIPFAAPPVGDLRWKAPQPVKNWEGVRAAVKFGPRCAQQPVFEGERLGLGQDETAGRDREHGCRAHDSPEKGHAHSRGDVEVCTS